MFRLAAIVALLLCLAHAAAAERFDFPAKSPTGVGPEEASVLVVYSSIDIDNARPLIAAFQGERPETRVIYHDLQSVDLYDRILRETKEGGTTADIAISSAMDLQMKLANDGYAMQRWLPEANVLPNWASWRDEVYGITFEPTVLVYHKPSFAEGGPPRTRADLIALLERRDPKLFGRIATYDPERSGFGLLVLARDVEHYPDFWRLVRLFGENGVKLYSSSAAIIDRVARGKFVLGYNPLGSYAAERAAREKDLGILLPEDYTVVFSRLALIPKAARSPEMGAVFLQFLLSEKGQQTIATRLRMNALHPRVTGPNTAGALRAKLGSRLRPIPVGPGLLVYLDQAKRRRLLKRWNRALGGR
ncbi:MAG: ABC transporter substrate-binding protein [Methyloligellaceae bacterium]